MTSNLHAAASRLLRIKDIGACDAQDFTDVVEACLDDHPADEHEPITREWLEKYRHSESRLDHIVFSGEMVSVAIRPEDGNCLLVVSLAQVPIRYPTTRGEFRRLCAALGVVLTEGE